MVDYGTFTDVTGSDRKWTTKKKFIILTFVAVAIVECLAIVAGTSYLTSSDTVFEELNVFAVKKPTFVRYGDFVTLEDFYRDYIMVKSNGRVHTAGYVPDRDRIQLLSSVNTAGVVNYGDKLMLVGSNNLYFSVLDSGELTVRLRRATPEAVFIVSGGVGPVKYGDQLSFKSVFGYVHVNHEGGRGDSPTITGIEKFIIGQPGMEDGVNEHQFLMYGDTIKLRNQYNLYLQEDTNGWMFVHPENDPFDEFVVLSPLHREGPVRFGDEVLLRANNGNAVYVAGTSYRLTTNLKFKATPFHLIGGVGLIKAGDQVALRADTGMYMNARGGSDERATLDQSGHYSTNHNFELVLV